MVQLNSNINGIAPYITNVQQQQQMCTNWLVDVDWNGNGHFCNH